MASLTQCTWVWASSGSWWWTGKPGVLQSWGRKESDTTERLRQLNTHSVHELIYLLYMMRTEVPPSCLSRGAEDRRGWVSLLTMVCPGQLLVLIDWGCRSDSNRTFSNPASRIVNKWEFTSSLWQNLFKVLFWRMEDKRNLILPLLFLVCHPHPPTILNPDNLSSSVFPTRLVSFHRDLQPLPLPFGLFLACLPNPRSLGL